MPACNRTLSCCLYLGHVPRITIIYDNHFFEKGNQTVLFFQPWFGNIYINERNSRWQHRDKGLQYTKWLMHLNSTQSTLLLSDHSKTSTVVLYNISYMSSCKMISSGECTAVSYKSFATPCEYTKPLYVKKMS